MLQEITEILKQKVVGRDGFGFNVRFDLGDTGSILIAGSNTPIEVSNGDGDADTTFVMAPEDLKSMLSGELPPMNAYMQGKMKVEGDVGKAMQFGTMFG